MHVDRAGTQIVSPGQCHPHLPTPGEERAEDQYRSPHLTNQVEWGLRSDVVGDIDHQRVIF